MCLQLRKLLDRICAQIHLGRLDTSVAKPERDFADITSGLQSVHGAAVPQYMRSDMFCGDRRRRAFDRRHTLPQPICKSVPRHPAPVTVQKQLRADLRECWCLLLQPEMLEQMWNTLNKHY